MQDEVLISTGALSELTRCPESTLKKWSNRGELPPAFRIGRSRGWRREDLPEMQRHIAELKQRHPRRRMSAAA
jgi:predicted DNA-binding transcriptional regulator AlpA